MNIQLSKVVSQVNDRFLLVRKKPWGNKIKLDDWLVLWAQQVSTLLILIAAIKENYPDKHLDKWQGRKIQYTTSFCQIT